jgi:hypothetical protein
MGVIAPDDRGHTADASVGTGLITAGRTARPMSTALSVPIWLHMFQQHHPILGEPTAPTSLRQNGDERQHRHHWAIGRSADAIAGTPLSGKEVDAGPWAPSSHPRCRRRPRRQTPWARA